jgi:hypothetical protein
MLLDVGCRFHATRFHRNTSKIDEVHKIIDTCMYVLITSWNDLKAIQYSAGLHSAGSF